VRERERERERERRKKETSRPLFTAFLADPRFRCAEPGCDFSSATWRALLSHATGIHNHDTILASTYAGGRYDGLSKATSTAKAAERAEALIGVQENNLRAYHELLKHEMTDALDGESVPPISRRVIARITELVSQPSVKSFYIGKGTHKATNRRREADRRVALEMVEQDDVSTLSLTADTHEWYIVARFSADNDLCLPRAHTRFNHHQLALAVESQAIAHFAFGEACDERLSNPTLVSTGNSSKHVEQDAVVYVSMRVQGTTTL